MMNALTIQIYESSEDGYVYNIYDTDAVDAGGDCESIDGGHCTTTLLNALGMATMQAEALIKKNEAEVKCICACGNEHMTSPN